MDEKQPRFVAIAQTAPPAERRKGGMGIVKSATVLVLLCVWLMGRRFYHAHCDGHQPQQIVFSYPGEKVKWEPCGEITNHPVECSTIDVPMDHFNATNSGNKTFSIPLIRLRARNATKNLLLNPGGPGGSGGEFIYRRGEQLSGIVGEGFHLLSFDPRGVNLSRPLASCYPDTEARRALSAVNDGDIVYDSPELYAWTQNYVRACVDTMGEHGKYINTPQTAADMNHILDAVGQEDMVYWGFSYGTLLGQTYAAMFPERSKRVIIDGVVNQFEWYEGRFENETLVDTEKVLRGFFDECIKAGKNCSLSTLGDTPEVLWDKVTTAADKLKDQPLSVYVNNSVYGLLDRQKLWFDGIFPALYKPQSWYNLSENLAKLLQGNATDAFLAYGGGDPWGSLGEANHFVRLSDARSGPKYWPQDRKSILDDVIAITNSSIFAAVQNSGFYVMQQWAVPRTHSYVPKTGVKTAHPLLILSTTYDPVCPLVSARSANAAFQDSKIVEVLGYGHCSVAVTSMCLARHVRAFLYEGTLPEAHTQCEVDSPYFVAPEEDGKVSAQMVFKDAQEQRIHIAQLEMARDMAWPRWRRG